MRRSRSGPAGRLAAKLSHPGHGLDARSRPSATASGPGSKCSRPGDSSLKVQLTEMAQSPTQFFAVIACLSICFEAEPKLIVMCSPAMCKSFRYDRRTDSFLHRLGVAGIIVGCGKLIEIFRNDAEIPTKFGSRSRGSGTSDSVVHRQIHRAVIPFHIVRSRHSTFLRSYYGPDGYRCQWTKETGVMLNIWWRRHA